MPRPNSYIYDSNSIKLVEVLIQYCRIGEIDTINEKYQAEICIESKWIEKEFIGVYDAKKHWNPMLQIENALQIGSEQVDYHIVRDRDSDYNIVTEIRYIKGYFWERLELHHFPIDLQELSISVISKLSSSEVKLISDDKRLSFVNMDAANTFIDQQKWKLFKLVKVSDSASYDSKGHQSTLHLVKSTDKIYAEMSRASMIFRSQKPPKIVATCYCARKPGYYLFNAYFLIFLITVSALTIFSVDCKLPQNRLQINVTLLLTSVSFKWVINRSLPTVSYLTSLDWYAIVCIFFVCLMCAWNGIIASTWDNDKPFAEWADFWAFIAFAALFFVINVGVTIWFYFAYDKIRKMKAKEARFLLMLKENLHRMNESPAIIGYDTANAASSNNYDNSLFEMSL